MNENDAYCAQFKCYAEEDAMSDSKPTTEFVTRGGAHEHRYIDGPLICWCPASSCTLEEFKAKRDAIAAAMKLSPQQPSENQNT